MHLKAIIEIVFNDALKAINDFKNDYKSAWSNVFWYVEVCIF